MAKALNPYGDEYTIERIIWAIVETIREAYIYDE